MLHRQICSIDLNVVFSWQLSELTFSAKTPGNAGVCLPWLDRAWSSPSCTMANRSEVIGLPTRIAHFAYRSCRTFFGLWGLIYSLPQRCVRPSFIWAAVHSEEQISSVFSRVKVAFLSRRSRTLLSPIPNPILSRNISSEFTPFSQLS